MDSVSHLILSVLLRGDLCVLCLCVDQDIGTAFVYTQSGVSWSQVAQLIPTGLSGASTFGTSLSFGSETSLLAVGANGAGSFVGAALQLLVSCFNFGFVYNQTTVLVWPLFSRVPTAD